MLFIFYQIVYLLLTRRRVELSQAKQQSRVGKYMPDSILALASMPGSMLWSRNDEALEDRGSLVQFLKNQQLQNTND
ncbi:hypothetical protein SC029_08135 [Legionella pneumophila serogroup 1]|nr:hypothetical protein [Legionella pneumophila]BCZ98387.1 hypothetical protein LEG80045_26430 [Legionella pneumophila]HAT1940586.1 hypothetical protein [Legionella pneumophila]HAT1990708.1 hypothetical protein [Legionella pneumophila]HAT1994581.1 hypothetical protein [Legionella pneumophila]HAT2052227.1 hypothetical protein [Legionella pneumophila]